MQEQNFKEKYTINTSNNCWEWNGYKDKKGYGYIHKNINGKTIKFRANKFFYEFYNPSIKLNELIKNSCGNNSCVNPSHLIIIQKRSIREIDIKKRLSEGYEIIVNGCWIWKKSLTPNGYPRISRTINRKTKYYRVHRIHYELYKETIPENNFIRHSCNNILCVNPDHLFISQESWAPRISLSERFYASYQINLSNNCWEWQKDIDRKGYGQIHSYRENKRVTLFAHRVSYELHKGTIPEKFLICHSCDNRKCVNPDHLWIGTQSDNMQDMIKKGRYNYGTKNRLSKLNHQQVLEIKNSRESGRFLSKKFDVSEATIINIRKNRTWRHLK